jgi:hypothetical protein
MAPSDLARGRPPVPRCSLTVHEHSSRRPPATAGDAKADFAGQESGVYSTSAARKKKLAVPRQTTSEDRWVQVWGMVRGYSTPSNTTPAKGTVSYIVGSLVKYGLPQLLVGGG